MTLFSPFNFCIQDENPELFYSVPWSYGTLGLLVAAEIQIIPCKKYVKVDYQPAYTMQDAIKIFSEEVNKKSSNEFVEGLMYSDKDCVIMTANQTDEAEMDKVREKERIYLDFILFTLGSYLSLDVCSS